MEVQKKKPGRKPTGRSRESVVQVRVTESELEYIKKIAKEHGMSLSTLLRSYAFTSTDPQGREDGWSLTIRGTLFRVSKDEAKDLLRQIADKLTEEAA